LTFKSFFFVVEFQFREKSTLDDFTLTVSCEALKFEQSVFVYTIAKKFTVLIQTDKAIYKPSDSVQFRVLLLNAELKPYLFKQITVKITDASGNVVYDKIVEKDDELVYESSLEIPEDPFLGDWFLSVQVDNELKMTKKTFEVKEYILPRFEVFSNTKQFVALTAGIINLSIHAKYNFGQLVKGNAKVKARQYEENNTETILKEKTFEVKDIENPTSLFIDLKQDLLINNVIKNHIVDIETEFEEKLTGKTMKTNSTVVVGKQGKFVVRMFKSERRFKPGFPFELDIQVYDYDGSMNLKDIVKIRTEYVFKLPRCVSETHEKTAVLSNLTFITKKLENGHTNLKLNVPQNTTSINLTITYFETTETYRMLAQKSKNQEYLKASVASKRFVEMQILSK
jgi:CD109 antigen